MHVPLSIKRSPLRWHPRVAGSAGEEPLRRIFVALRPVGLPAQQDIEVTRRYSVSSGLASSEVDDSRAKCNLELYERGRAETP